MRGLIFYVLIFASLPAVGQDSKFYVGVNTAGVWNSYLLSQKPGPYLFQGRINGSIGIQSKYSFGKKFQIDAQLNLASKNFGSGVDFSFLKQIDPNDPVYPTSGQITWSVRQLFLEIPVSINYVFSTEKPTTFFCSLGLTNSFLLSTKYANGRSIFGSGEVGERYKNYLVSVKTGLGVLFPMGNGFYGSGECYGNIYPESVYSGSYIHGNPFQLALGFGVMKKIGRAKATS